TTDSGTTGTTTGTGTTPGTSTGTTTASNPISQKISSKPQLSSKVQNMLPSGMSLETASAGFKNQGQFLAALHVSKNLNIPFADLKGAMLGTPVARTTSDGTATGGTTTTGGATTGGTTTGG